MTAGPHWTATVSALTIAAVAVFGAFIAWNMYRTNHNLLRERLYDRRFEVFEATQALIAAIGEEKSLSWDDAKRFSDIAQRARFMFSTEDAAYFELLRSKAMDLAALTSVTEKQLTTRESDEKERQRDLCTWFDEQVEGIFSRMNKYLLFEK